MFLKKRPYLIPFFIIGAIALAGTVVMLLWNAIIPGLTGWAFITWPKALGLLVLCKLLFGGFHGRHKHGGPWGRHGHWREKWANMSDEQRAEMKQRWQQRCGRWGARETPQQP
ncbi:MAG TPA: hypothetical protein PK760_11625 [Flavobacteriales bacterium]|nr:hypothetical protein [Flavobacteriales bacterium]